MLLMLDTSHSQISPYGPLRLSPLRDNFKLVSTARLSSGLDRGEKSGMRWGWVGQG